MATTQNPTPEHCAFSLLSSTTYVYQFSEHHQPNNITA